MKTAFILQPLQTGFLFYCLWLVLPQATCLFPDVLQLPYQSVAIEYCNYVINYNSLKYFCSVFVCISLKIVCTLSLRSTVSHYLSIQKVLEGPNVYNRYIIDLEGYYRWLENKTKTLILLNLAFSLSTESFQWIHDDILRKWYSSQCQLGAISGADCQGFVVL